jgi:hypothetical protein
VTIQAMSYEELGQRLGIAAASARRLVNRRRWPKTRGNDGRAVVQVPVEFLHDLEHGSADGPKGGLKDNPKDSPADGSGTGPRTEATAELEARLTKAQAELVEMALRLGAAQARVEVLEQVNADLRRAQEDLRADRDAWRGQMERLTLAAPKGERRGWWPFRRAL